MSLKYAAAVLGLLAASSLAVYLLSLGPEVPPGPLGSSLRILAIGDSITEGQTLSHPDHAVDRMTEALRAVDVDAIILNRGRGGESAKSWARDEKGILSEALATAKSAGFRKDDLAWISLGTNDAQFEYDVDGFEADLRSLCERLKAEGYRPVLNGVPWQTPNSLPDAKFQGEPRLRLLREVNRRIERLISEGVAEPGDLSAYEHFEAHPSHLTDGLHPNKVGAIHLGRAWARAAVRLTPPRP
jgi:lysophospholipase L1-like esterase